MISVNEIVNNALQKCNLIGDGESASGTIAKIALGDLHDVICDLNENDYLQENQVSKELKGIKDKVVISDDPDDENADLIVKVLPSKVISLARKVGNRYVPLSKANKEFFYATNRLGLGKAYTSDTEYNEESDTMELVLRIDSNISSDYMLTVNAGIPEYQLTDNIQLSNRYKSLIEDGLCYKLAIRYKLTSYIPIFSSEYESAKYNVMRNNTMNRPINNYEATDMLDNYYNALAGNGW